MNCSIRDHGNYSVTVTATDSNRISATSTVRTIVVAGAPVATAFPSSSSPSLGPTVWFNSTAGGGTGPLGFAWTFGDGDRGTGSSVEHEYSSAGPYSVMLWVNDSAGGSVEKTLSVTVGSHTTVPPSTGPGPGGTPRTLEVALAAIGIVALVVIALAVFLRRRRRPAPGASQPEPESAEEPISPWSPPR